MKIRFVRSVRFAFGKDGHANEGEVYDVPDQAALNQVASGAAAFFDESIKSNPIIENRDPMVATELRGPDRPKKLK